MVVSRDSIIDTLHQQLAVLPHVLATWLEGADANGAVDAFSDIDFCCSVQPGMIPTVVASAQQALETLGVLNLVHSLDLREEDGQVVFHLQGTPPSLLVDFNVYVGRGSQFNRNDEIEKPLILFDRTGVVRFVEPDWKKIAERQQQRLAELQSTVAQNARIEKYVTRGEFLEAFGYYHRWLLTPLIEVLRMRYTPLHTDYYIVHISRHLPSGALRRLEDLFKVNSVEEIGRKCQQAVQFFEETAAVCAAQFQATLEETT